MRKLSTTLLAQVVAAAAVATQPFIFSNDKDMAELLAEGLVLKNETINDGKGNFAFKATDKALAANGGTNTQEAGAATTKVKPTFVIKTGVALPKIAREGGNNSGSKYPIEELEQGQSFFIPAPADMKSPSKSFGSLVAAANKKHEKNDNTFKRFTTRSVLGDDWDQPGVKGIGVFRLSADEEAAAKAKAFPATA